MMDWKSTDFIVAIMFSIAYFLVAFLNYIGDWHAPVVTLLGPKIHPLYCLGYLITALFITWSIYFLTRLHANRATFFIAIFVGIGLIFSGIFLWKVADKIQNTVIPMVSDANNA